MARVIDDGLVKTYTEVYVKNLQDILDTFENEDLRALCVEMIKTIPEYWYHVGASSTGKYHPQYAVGEGGLMRHTVALVQIMNHLFVVSRAFYTPRERDLLRIAGVMHDSRKSGSQADYEASHYTNFDHPLKAAAIVRGFKDKGWSNDEIEIVANAVESHMGQWNVDSRTGATLPLPKTKYQTLLHWCDYLASRKDIEIKFE